MSLHLLSPSGHADPGWYPEWVHRSRASSWMDNLANNNDTERRKITMKIPAIIRKENRAPMAWAAILTFIAWNAFGFGWFGLPSLGFVTAGGAEQLATAKMEKVAIPLAAQLCATKFNAQDSAIVAAKREKLQLAQYTQARGQQLDKAWIMLGDNQYENQKVIDACAELILASEVRKAAVLQK